MTRRQRRWQLLPVAGATIVLLSGCAGSQDEAAGDSARRLLEAAQGSDGAAACAQLAPAARSELEQQSGTSCEEAILEEDLGDGSGELVVEVFDTMAQARVGDQTVFLSRYDGRWLVVGAACTPISDRPYDCSIGLP